MAALDDQLGCHHQAVSASNRGSRQDHPQRLDEKPSGLGRRAQFANDLTDARTLRAVTGTSNESECNWTDQTQADGAGSTCESVGGTRNSRRLTWSHPSSLRSCSSHRTLGILPPVTSSY
jgi:hypothetical protein